MASSDVTTPQSVAFSPSVSWVCRWTAGISVGSYVAAVAAIYLVERRREPGRVPVRRPAPAAASPAGDRIGRHAGTRLHAGTDSTTRRIRPMNAT